MDKDAEGVCKMLHIRELQHGDQRVGRGRVSGCEVGNVVKRAGTKNDVRFEVGVKECLSKRRHAQHRLWLNGRKRTESAPC